MTTGRHSRDPEIRPSKFGAGYTVGGPAAAPATPTPATPAVAPVITTEAASTPTTTEVIPETPASAAQVPYIATPAVTPSTQSADARPNLLATVSLALAVVFGAILSPITLAMSYVARSQIKRTGERGADVAFAAMVVSVVFLGIGLLSVGLVEFGAI